MQKLTKKSFENLTTIFLFVVFTISTMYAPVLAQQSDVLVSDCNDNISTRKSSEITTSCDEWFIQLKRDGKEWGRITASTREEVIAKLNRDIAFQKRYARFFDDSTILDRDYSNPSEPICKLCGRNTAKSGISKQSSENQKMLFCSKTNYQPNHIQLYAKCMNAPSLIGDWIGRVAKAGVQYVRASDRPLPYANIFDVTKDYITAIRDAQRRATELEQRLKEITDFSEIAAEMDKLGEDVDNLDYKYRNLPKAAQDWLNGQNISVAGLYELSNGKGMRILQNGDKFTIMIGSNYSSVMVEGIIEGNVLSSPNSKMRAFVSDEILTKCGLPTGNNYYNAPVDYRLVLSSDGKTLTDESTMLPHTLGHCNMTGGARFVTMTKVGQ